MLKKKNLKIWAHIGFWCLCLLAFLINRLSAIKLSVPELAQVSILHTVSIPLIFYASYFLTYFVLKNKKNFVYVILFCLTFFFFPEFGKPLVALFFPPLFSSPSHTIFFNFIFLFMVIQTSFWGVLFYLGIDWYQKNEEKKDLERQNLQSELKLLKNQINPHFLFNTLNNIDSMIKKNPDCASQSIVELSEMMRYMIYEANVEKVPLKKELDYIDNYLHLQKLQYGNQELVEYTLTGEPERIEVAPMLFIPFVENAFKHCTNKETRHAIRFEFLCDADKIRFEAMNIADKSQVISKDKTSGIGLDTVKRRLEILYHRRHDLQIQEKNDYFCVSLTLKIND